MQLTIHDVGHGQCVSLRHDDGNAMVWDCGSTSNSDPSEFLPAYGVRNIERFFITNYDQDHISGIRNLFNTIPIQWVHRNRSITRRQLEALKMEQGGRITDAMRFVLDLMDTYSAGEPVIPPAFPGVEVTCFTNAFGRAFDDTNNISLVTVSNCYGIKVVVAGDMERRGWDGLLGQAGFHDAIANTDVYVASHHGRENGFSDEVMDIARPRVTVFSDSSIEHDTQETTDRYRAKTRGFPYGGRDRFVLTTRTDRDVSFEIQLPTGVRL